MGRVYIKEEVCIGCHLCEVYCQLQHAQSTDLIKTFKRESPRPLARLRVEEKGALSFTVRCQQCDEPPCVHACLTGAIQKDPEGGIVTVDAERCVGCWTCILACPFGAILQDANLRKIAKCDLCTGKNVPACVAHCPNEALVYVEVQNVIHKLEANADIIGG